MIGTRGRQLVDDLFAIEQGFWLEGEDYFREHLDDHCLLAFPQMPEMHGARPREEVAATAQAPGRWRDLRVSSRQLVRPVPEVAIISYRADVLRADGEPYAAFVSSAYVRREGGWKLAFHQHSPIG
jgi:hypothetical protein